MGGGWVRIPIWMSKGRSSMCQNGGLSTNTHLNVRIYDVGLFVSEKGGLSPNTHLNVRIYKVGLVCGRMGGWRFIRPLICRGFKKTGSVIGCALYQVTKMFQERVEIFTKIWHNREANSKIVSLWRRENSNVIFLPKTLPGYEPVKRSQSMGILIMRLNLHYNQFPI